MKLIYGSDNVDIRYKTGFNFPDPVFFFDMGKKSYLYLNNLELGHAQKENKNHRLIVRSISPIVKKALKNKDKTTFRNKIALLVTQSLKAKEITVSADFPVDIADYLRKNKISLSISRELYPERKVKTKKEVEILKNILKRMYKAFERVEEILKKSAIEKGKIIYKGEALTSEFLKIEIDRVFLENNLKRTQENIVSSGVQASMVHHRGRGEIKAHSPIIVDLFPQDEETGYYGDMTRTYVKGKPNKKLEKMYDSVFLAQEKAFNKIRPGAKVKEVHKECEDVFAQNGFVTKDMEGFIHTTGHGLGLEIHERPSIGNSEEILEEGNVITIEPGLYYKKMGGVRIEDVVVVTKEGYRNLTNYPKKLIIP